MNALDGPEAWAHVITSLLDACNESAPRAAKGTLSERSAGCVPPGPAA
jgi:hypothetical protein